MNRVKGASMVLSTRSQIVLLEHLPCISHLPYYGDDIPHEATLVRGWLILAHSSRIQFILVGKMEWKEPKRPVMLTLQWGAERGRY